MKQLHTITSPAIYDAPCGSIRTTTRLGPKWRDVEVGEIIELSMGSSDTDRTVFGKGVVVRVDYLAFDHLNHRTHIATNHSTRSRAGVQFLTSAMMRAYGDKFTIKSPVSVLFYRRVA